jgi:hypothetical protein
MTKTVKPDRKTLDAIRKTTGQCPFCGRDAMGHSYYDIASAEVGSSDDQALERLVRVGSWSEAAQFQVANLEKDIRVWRALLCHDQVAIMPVILTFEVWSDDFRGEPIKLSADQSGSLVSFIEERWKAL